MDLREEAEAMGLRRLWALILGLPPEAATWRKEYQWTWSHELAAANIEVLDGWMRVFARMMGARELGKPVQIPRPGEIEKKPTNDPVVIRRFFARTG